MTQLAYAESNTPTQGSPTSPLISMAPLVFIFVIFYFLLIRPQQKKVKEHKKLLENVKVGDKVITSSGFYATISAIGDTTFEIKLAENVKVKILKGSVSEVLSNTETTPVVKG
jgi:preprotein translocase subunit YajC